MRALVLDVPNLINNGITVQIALIASGLPRILRGTPTTFSCPREVHLWQTSPASRTG